MVKSASDTPRTTDGHDLTHSHAHGRLVTLTRKPTAEDGERRYLRTLYLRASRDTLVGRIPQDSARLTNSVFLFTDFV